MTNDLDGAEVKTVSTDDRGRAYLGSDYRDSDVRIAILGEETQQCQKPDCESPAVGIYEGIVEPADTIRYAACDEHAPEIEPVEEVDGE